MSQILGANWRCWFLRQWWKSSAKLSSHTWPTMQYQCFVQNVNAALHGNYRILNKVLASMQLISSNDISKLVKHSLMNYFRNTWSAHQTLFAIPRIFQHIHQTWSRTAKRLAIERYCFWKSDFNINKKLLNFLIIY